MRAAAPGAPRRYSYGGNAYAYPLIERAIPSGTSVVTTTYGYDAFGTRVLQTGTSTTTIYPFKGYSVASSTGSGAKFATTTEYVFNGDTLVATIDQETASGNATGTAKTRYIPSRMSNSCGRSRGGSSTNTS